MGFCSVGGCRHRCSHCRGGGCAATPHLQLHECGMMSGESMGCIQGCECEWGCHGVRMLQGRHALCPTERTMVRGRSPHSARFQQSPRMHSFNGLRCITINICACSPYAVVTRVCRAGSTLCKNARNSTCVPIPCAQVEPSLVI